MSYDDDLSIRYRDHAEELRTIADAMKDASVKVTLRTIADDYERMVRSMRTIAETERILTDALKRLKNSN